MENKFVKGFLIGSLFTIAILVGLHRNIRENSKDAYSKNKKSRITK